MKRSLSLTGVTVNAMALIAPGAFLWTTFQTQAALTHHGSSTASEMWTGLLFSLILAMLTAYSYAELARVYPDAGTGSSYYFAEAAFLEILTVRSHGHVMQEAGAKKPLAGSSPPPSGSPLCTGCAPAFERR